MAFLDEKIVAERLALNKQSHRNIYDEEVYAGNERLHFIPTKLFDSKAEVMLPDSFMNMPEILAETKYPSVQRPQVIKTNENGTVNFCFNLFESPIEKEQIEPASASFRSILQKAQPSVMQLEHKTECLIDTDISWFAFRSFSMDEQIYNLIFITSIGGKLMNGTMNCPKGLEKDWRPIMRQVVLSIEDHAKDENKEAAKK